MSSTENQAKSTIIEEYEWIMRPCEMYKEEYSDCTSIKARFHQYFIFGQPIDCAQWKRDLNNCIKWVDNKDEKAAVQLIDSEKDRRQKRLKAHYDNDVWKKRTKPPEDWDKPLPESISKNYEYSYLGLRAKELRGEATGSKLEQKFCNIL